MIERMDKSEKNWNLTGKFLKIWNFPHSEKMSSILMHQPCLNASKLWLNGPNMLSIWKKSKKISMDYQIKAKKACGER